MTIPFPACSALTARQLAITFSSLGGLSAASHEPSLTGCPYNRYKLISVHYCHRALHVQIQMDESNGNGNWMSGYHGAEDNTGLVVCPFA